MAVFTAGSGMLHGESAGGAKGDGMRTDIPIPVYLRNILSEAKERGSGQVLVIKTAACGNTRAEAFLLEAGQKGWRWSLPPMTASVGRKGIAGPGAKREGDGCSPFGFYAIGMAFGYASTGPTRMSYRCMTEDDIWVDDPESPDYNRLVRRGSTSAKSFEEMRRRDDLYKLGLVVAYNTDDPVPHLGSAIFIHLWGRPFQPTAGCAAFSEKNLRRVLEKLDPERSPMVCFTVGSQAKSSEGGKGPPY
jgi:L,D-peptidoglycan transpeptidase YkuD (ErfK/YbiS/YcfS/YnhG family)